MLGTQQVPTSPRIYSLLSPLLGDGSLHEKIQQAEGGSQPFFYRETARESLVIQEKLECGRGLHVGQVFQRRKNNEGLAGKSCL